jgi:FKBP-type peptidyl-prolyl cis-trans isomerase
MFKLQFFVFGLLLVGALTGCQQTDINANGDTGATYASNLEDIKTYATSKGLSGTTTTSGLYYASTKPSSSTVMPVYSQELEFNYKLYVLSRSTSNTAIVTDKLVDSAYAVTPAYFPFFAGALKAGLEEGLKLMHEGEKAILLMPSILGFGSVPALDGLIPANSPVRFDVTLKRSRTEDQQIDDYIAANKLVVTEKTPTGLRFIKTKSNPTADSLRAGQTLTINFAGKLLRATSGFAGGTGTDTKTVGTAKYIPGFEEGLAKLKVGEKATVIFPSSLGYGATGTAQNGTYVIPPYSPISFDLEVVSAK